MRYVPVRGFKHRVIFFEKDDLLTVVAIAHSSRRRHYWLWRLRRT